jgi:hypothetical protein
MKNESGIRLSRHRLSRLEVMPSHHAVNILQQKEAFSLLLNRAVDDVPKGRRNLLVRDGGKERWIVRTGVSGCLLQAEIVQQIVSEGGDEDCRVRTT